MNPLDLLLTFEPDRWRELAGERPVLVHLLDGYVDAGAAGRGLAEHLMATCRPRVLVAFDHDQLHDYRSRRPQLIFDTNEWVSMTEFELALYRCTDAGGRPFLLLHGPEPDTQWNRAVAAVLQLARFLGVEHVVSAHGIPMGVPHTRPVLVTTSSTDPAKAGDNLVWIDHVQVPGSFSAVVEFRAGEEGFLGQSFVAHVPHYLAQGQYPPAVLALVRRLAAATGLTLEEGDLSAQVAKTEATLAEEVAGDDEIGQLVAALEGQYDELRAKGRPTVPSADEIGEAVEQFLAEHDEKGE